MNTAWRFFFAVTLYVLIGAAFGGWARHNSCTYGSEEAAHYTSQYLAFSEIRCSITAAAIWPVSLPAVMFSDYFAKGV